MHCLFISSACGPQYQAFVNLTALHTAGKRSLLSARLHVTGLSHGHNEISTLGEFLFLSCDVASWFRPAPEQKLTLKGKCSVLADGNQQGSGSRHHRTECLSTQCYI